MLRQLRLHDAPSLFDHFNDPDVLRYIAPCPSTIEGFRQFVRWTRTERRHGRHACWGIVPAGSTAPVGILQVWPVERNFSTAELGFVLGRAYWGTGVFGRSARLLLDAMFVDGLFGPPGVFRLESRAVDANARGCAALRKLGAKSDGVLRGAFHDGDRTRNHIMWSILAPEWHANRPATIV
jgi:ribosomal-protein-alanine N-acetyltransferase